MSGAILWTALITWLLLVAVAVLELYQHRGDEPTAFSARTTRGRSGTS